MGGAFADEGSYNIYGVGTMSCGTWVSAKAAHDRVDDYSEEMTYTHIIGWISGFVSGFGYVYSDGLRKTDSDGMTEFVTQYCKSSPLDSVSDAASALVLELTKK